MFGKSFEMSTDETFTQITTYKLRKFTVSEDIDPNIYNWDEYRQESDNFASVGNTEKTTGEDDMLDFASDEYVVKRVFTSMDHLATKVATAAVVRTNS
jgi:hypothetical protein